MSEVIYCHTCNKDQPPVKSKDYTHCPDCGYIFNFSLPFKKPIAPLIPNRKKIQIPEGQETYKYPIETDYDAITKKTQKIITDGLTEICKNLIAATSEEVRAELSETWTIDLWTNSEDGGYNFDITSH